MALSKEELDKIIAEREYMGIKGWKLLEERPKLKDYPRQRRINALWRMAEQAHRLELLRNSLGFGPEQLSLPQDDPS